eukprot:gene14574-17228_t
MLSTSPTSGASDLAGDDLNLVTSDNSTSKLTATVYYNNFTADPPIMCQKNDSLEQNIYSIGECMETMPGMYVRATIFDESKGFQDRNANTCTIEYFTDDHCTKDYTTTSTLNNTCIEQQPGFFMLFNCSSTSHSIYMCSDQLCQVDCSPIDQSTVNTPATCDPSPGQANPKIFMDVCKVIHYGQQDAWLTPDCVFDFKSTPLETKPKKKMWQRAYKAAVKYQDNGGLSGSESESESESSVSSVEDSDSGSDQESDDGSEMTDEMSGGEEEQRKKKSPASSTPAKSSSTPTSSKKTNGTPNNKSTTKSSSKPIKLKVKAKRKQISDSSEESSESSSSESENMSSSFSDSSDQSEVEEEPTRKHKRLKKMKDSAASSSSSSSSTNGTGSKDLKLSRDKQSTSVVASSNSSNNSKPSSKSTKSPVINPLTSKSTTTTTTTTTIINRASPTAVEAVGARTSTSSLNTSSSFTIDETKPYYKEPPRHSLISQPKKTSPPSPWSIDNTDIRPPPPIVPHQSIPSVSPPRGGSKYDEYKYISSSASDLSPYKPLSSAYPPPLSKYEDYISDSYKYGHGLGLSRLDGPPYKSTPPPPPLTRMIHYPTSYILVTFHLQATSIVMTTETTKTVAIGHTTENIGGLEMISPETITNDHLLEEDMPTVEPENILETLIGMHETVTGIHVTEVDGTERETDWEIWTAETWIEEESLIVVTWSTAEIS